MQIRSGGKIDLEKLDILTSFLSTVLHVSVGAQVLNGDQRASGKEAHFKRVNCAPVLNGDQTASRKEARGWVLAMISLESCFRPCAPKSMRAPKNASAYVTTKFLVPSN